MDIETQIQKELKKFNSLVECFLTVGLTPEDINLYLNNQKEVSPVILSKFPSHYSPPDTIQMFCFPWGLKVSRSPQETLNDSFSFNILTDQGQQLYCAAIVIYESAPKTPIYREKMPSNIDLEYLRSKESLILPTGPKSEAKRSRSALRIENIEKSREFSGRLEKVNINTGQVMVPKCLVLISRYPFLETLKNILTGIYKIMRTKLDLPFECYLSHLFLRVPVPPRGEVQVIYQILSYIILVKQPPPNKLPLLDCNLSHLFKSLNVSKILKIFSHLLLEENVVFLSSSNEKLCAASHSFLSFLYPFQWSFVFISILPCQLIDFLYCPVKFIFGLNSKYKEEVITRCSRNVLIVDLDLGDIESHDEIVSIKHTATPEPPSLPEHYAKKLIKQLSEATEFLENKPNSKFDEKKTDEIRNFFFQFFVSVFLEYEGYLIKGNDFTDVSRFFDVDKFLLKQRSDKEFYMRFFRTNMFANFCKKNIRPESHDQQMENLLFNNHIASKKNRSYFSIHKKNTDFLNDTSNDHSTKYTIPIAENCFSKKSYFFYYTFPKFNYEELAKFGLPREFLKRSVEYQFPYIEKIDRSSCQVYPSPQLDTIFAIWIELWTSCLWVQEDIEINERIKEILSFLSLIDGAEISNFGLYLKLINGCIDVYPSIALYIFSYMQKNRVLFDNNASVLLNKSLHRLFSRNKFVNIEEDLIKPHQETKQDLGYFNQKIRKRTFNMKKQDCVNPQKVNIGLIQKCQTCGKSITINNEYLKNFCCKSLMQNMLTCVVGESNCLVELVKLHPLPTLNTIFQRYLEKNNHQICLNDLRKKSEIFWNLIWNFNRVSLESKFFVPYENENSQEEVKIFLRSEENIVSDITPYSHIEQAIQTINPLLLIN